MCFMPSSSFSSSLRSRFTIASFITIELLFCCYEKGAHPENSQCFAFSYDEDDDYVALYVLRCRADITLLGTKTVSY